MFMLLLVYMLLIIITVYVDAAVNIGKYFVVIGVYVDVAVVNGMGVVYLLLLMFGYAAVHTGMSVI